MKTEVLRVDGMMCDHCKNSVETTVAALAGVQSVKADVKAGLVTVEYEEGSAERAVIVQAIDELGFDVIG